VGRPLPADIIAALTGIYKDGADLVSELLADRRQDRQASERKLARVGSAKSAKVLRRRRKS
jgi:hypothetical protein